MGGAEGPNLAAVDAFKALSLLRFIFSCGYCAFSLQQGLPERLIITLRCHLSRCPSFWPLSDTLGVAEDER